ncbi:ribosome small subunit-dependent GTPase A [Heyndrickxia camelliae]|uniref:Small ribosomal subunit biogenesis GTPase RsgA n=1 Tax=Heyndrickxia camelliae TaxID=1707093 RepID=A0A2N3LQT0_9BACI|nr:ribosome small subunit-dependent GTPase A [Heyndrickxia camelliae]PKR87012.1 ribosome small subunit-dependent GTPase A [Heyndrickxia camelliae]
MPKGKIIKALSGFYYVLDEKKLIQCRGRGVFRKNKITPLVGDYVEYQAENDREGYIMEILPRENELIRPPISNVDQAILLFSAKEPDFSTALLDRFLVLVEGSGIIPVICVTKMDLLQNNEIDIIESYVNDYRNIGYEVFLTSSKMHEGVNIILEKLKGKTSVFAGQSGVGKSSLLNAINPDLSIKTDDISTHLGRGRHTTRHVELIEIANGEGLVADTPGFSSLDFDELDAEQLGNCFPEMESRKSDCKFRGCLHLNEPKCAVKMAVQKKEIPDYRYQHYLQFLQEIKDRKPRY